MGYLKDAVLAGVIGAVISAICFYVVHYAGVGFTNFDEALTGGIIAGFFAALGAFVGTSRKVERKKKKVRKKKRKKRK